MKRGKRKKSKNILIYYNNINGLNSKRESMEMILNDIKPELVCLCETKLGNLKSAENWMTGYKVIGRCSKAGKGGLVIAARKDCYSEYMDITT